MGLSLKPSDAHAGGFLDDVDVTLKECRFVLWDYLGQAKQTVALHVQMQEGEAVHHQYYSAGDPEKLTVSPDGTMLTPLAGATGLNNNTNCSTFISSIVNAGFPEDKIADDISVFDGLVAHVNQIAQPKRAGLKDQKDRTYLLVTKIVRLPWEAAPKPVAKGAPAPKPAAPAAATKPAAVAATPAPTASPAAIAPAEPALVDRARGLVLQILAEQGGASNKPQLMRSAYTVLANDPEKNAIIKLIFDDGFLKAAAQEEVFKFDGSQVSLG